MTDKDGNKIETDPAKAEGVIVLVKQPDGNWKGWMLKNGKLIEERQINPEYTLQALLTHE